MQEGTGNTGNWATLQPGKLFVAIEKAFVNAMEGRMGRKKRRISPRKLCGF
jgi:hypothetical protein